MKTKDKEIIERVKNRKYTSNNMAELLNLELFNKYYYEESDIEKRNIKEEFLDFFWVTAREYKYSVRSFRYRVCSNGRDELDEFFRRYEKMEYKVLNSRVYKNRDRDYKEPLSPLGMIQLKVNSNYGVYIDKNVYLKKEYYRELANIKNLYYQYKNNSYDGLDIMDEIIQTEIRVQKYKNESIANKFTMSKKKYREFVNRCFDRIFEKFIPFEVLGDSIESGNGTMNIKLENDELYDICNDVWRGIEYWDEAHWIVGFVNKSLTFYMKNLVSRGDLLEDKFCIDCNKPIHFSRKSKRCESCAEKHSKQYKEEYQKTEKQKQYQKEYHKTYKRKTLINEKSCIRCNIKLVEYKPSQKYCDICREIVAKENKSERNKRAYKKKKTNYDYKDYF